MQAYSLPPGWNAGDTSLNPIDLQVSGFLQNNTTNSSEVSSSYVFIFATLIFLSFLFSWSISISILLQFYPSAQEVSCHVPNKMVQAGPTSSSSAVTVSDWSVSISKKTWAPPVSFGKPTKSPRASDSNETGEHDSLSWLLTAPQNGEKSRPSTGSDARRVSLLTTINMPWSCYTGHLAKYFVTLLNKWMSPPQQSKGGSCRCPKRPRYSHQRL